MVDAGAVLFGAVVGAIVALVAAYLTNQHAEVMEASRRDYEDRVRSREAGIVAANLVLSDLNRIRAVFEASDPADPDQQLFEEHYYAGGVHNGGVENAEVARILDGILDCYWHSFLAFEDGEYTPRTLNAALFQLARETVRAYQLGTTLPSDSVLTAISSEIKANGDLLDEQYEAAREAWLDSRLKEKAASQTAATSPSDAVRSTDPSPPSDDGAPKNLATRG